MVKATLPLALAALLLSLATTQAATIPVQKRDSSGQWNAILSVSKNADITVKDLCRGVLPPVTATFTTTLAPSSTVTVTSVQPLTTFVTEEMIEMTTSTTTEPATTTITDTVETTITTTVTSLLSASTDGATPSKRDTTSVLKTKSSVLKTKFDALLRADPSFVNARCMGIVAPDTVTATATAYSAEPTYTLTVQDLTMMTNTKTIPSTVTNVATVTDFTTIRETATVIKTDTTTILEQPPSPPPYPTYPNPLVGLDARSVAKFPGWDGVEGGVWGQAGLFEGDGDCVSYCVTQSNPSSEAPCGWVFYSSGRDVLNCYGRQKYGISDPFTAATSDLAFGAAIYFLGTCDDAKAAGAPAEALADCLDSVNHAT